MMIFVGLMIWVPIGLIAPGGAFGEDRPRRRRRSTAAVQARTRGDPSLFDALPDVNQECACVPNNINEVTFSGNTMLAGYQPPWVKDRRPGLEAEPRLPGARGWRASRCSACPGLRSCTGSARWLVPPRRRTGARREHDALEELPASLLRSSAKTPKPGFVEKTLAGITGSIESGDLLRGERPPRWLPAAPRPAGQAAFASWSLIVAATALRATGRSWSPLYALTLVAAPPSRRSTWAVSQARVAGPAGVQRHRRPALDLLRRDTRRCSRSRWAS